MQPPVRSPKSKVRAAVRFLLPAAGGLSFSTRRCKHSMRVDTSVTRPYADLEGIAINSPPSTRTTSPVT